MAATKIYIDVDSRKLTDFAGGTILSMSGKRGSIVDYELAYIQNRIPIAMPIGSTVEVGLKAPSANAGSYLFHTTATRSGWGSGSKWFFRMTLTANIFTSVAGTDIDFEILLILPDGQRIPSVTFPFNIEKNVIS